LAKIQEKENLSEMENRKFSKMVIAKFEPDYKCFAPDGSILIVIPKKKVKRGTLNYYAESSYDFVDSMDKSMKARFGWVKTTQEFLFDDFIEKYVGNTTDTTELEHIFTMLESIADLRDDVPVAATYAARENSGAVFTVHRVFL
jgi:hypothetical protein